MRRPTQAAFLALLLALPTMAQADIDANAYTESLREAFNAAHPDLAIDELPMVEARSPQVIKHGPRDQDPGKIALTFDACSQLGSNRLNEAVLDKLRDHQIPATLFLGGLWMADNPELTRELHDDPQFEIATHAHGHPDLTELTEKDIRLQIAFAQLMSYSLTGEIPRHFRPPFVQYNETVTEIAADLGLKLVHYDIASGDADKDLSAEEIAAQVLDNVQPGSIVVLHLHEPDLATAEALAK
ncbi:polysaccharide deacetylase family protein, partial [Gammaproteobacteria bacterium AB-CW1]|nr:polysaccharide deacetylase family protein [Gammaproteobacteria bacterium AB-CW1]